MKITLKPLTLAVLIAGTQLSAPVFALAASTPAAHALPAAEKTPIAIRSPADWIIYDDTTVTPVADPVSIHLEAARKAFGAKDKKKAAAEMRTVVRELKEQSAKAASIDMARAKAEMKLAHDTARRMEAVAGRVGAAAAGIESGKITTAAELDKAINKADRADMERRWLVADVTTWYPVSGEPQQHFSSAVEAFAKKDYREVSSEIRKSSGYMRLEAARATGDVKLALENSVAELDELATAVEKGTVKDEKIMDTAFSKADHALAMAHRVQASESWSLKQYNEVGYELKAAAHDLESSAGWAGQETKKNVMAVVANSRALGDKLATGANWTRDEVSKGIESLGNALDKLGYKIGVLQQATPVKSGA